MRAHLGAQIDAYLDGSLDEKDRQEADRHLQDCSTCKAELKAIQALAGRIAQARPETPQGPFKEYWQRLLGRHKEVKTMTAIQRLKRVVESNVHSAIDAMEEPSKMIKHLLREMESAIQDAREEVVESIVLEKGLAHRHQEASANIKKWEERAALALKSGRDDLAREALKEQMSLEGLAEDLKQEHKMQEARVSELKRALVQLERQLEGLRRRKGIWLSQAQNALGRSDSRRVYQTAYSELARMLEGVHERALTETAHREISIEVGVEETMKAMEESQTLEQRLSALRQRLQK